MKYRKDEDNRYRVNFMRSTEELMDRLTVKEFIAYLEENAKLEDEGVEWIDSKAVDVKYYDLQETDKLRKEFIITEDGRVFYWISLIKKAELIDYVREKEEDKKVTDFREAKEVAIKTAAQLRAEDNNWSWKVQVLKSEIKVWWGYLQYVDKEDSHFTIKMGDESDFMVALNERGEYMTGVFMGDKFYSDGSLCDCVVKLLRGIAGIAHSEY